MGRKPRLAVVIKEWNGLGNSDRLSPGMNLSAISDIGFVKDRRFAGRRSPRPSQVPFSEPDGDHPAGKRPSKAGRVFEDGISGKDEGLAKRLFPAATRGGLVKPEKWQAGHAAIVR